MVRTLGENETFKEFVEKSRRLLERIGSMLQLPGSYLAQVLLYLGAILAPGLKFFGSCIAAFFVAIGEAIAWIVTQFDTAFKASKVFKYTCATILWIVLAPILVAGAVCYVAFLAPFVIGFLLYFFARVYIVAESFLSLRHVPVGVYQDVSWAQYVLHL